MFNTGKRLPKESYDRFSQLNADRIGDTALDTDGNEITGSTYLGEATFIAPSKSKSQHRLVSVEPKKHDVSVVYLKASQFNLLRHYKG